MARAQVQQSRDDLLVTEVQSVKDADRHGDSDRRAMSASPSRTTIIASNLPATRRGVGGQHESGCHVSPRRRRTPTSTGAFGDRRDSSPCEVPSSSSALTHAHARSSSALERRRARARHEGRGRREHRDRRSRARCELLNRQRVLTWCAPLGVVAARRGGQWYQAVGEVAREHPHVGAHRAGRRRRSTLGDAVGARANALTVIRAARVRPRYPRAPVRAVAGRRP